ncbi:TPA: Glutamate--cysteine ligase B, chloroplastic [Trebouxia sp. C0005]|nr:MAG: gamma-glutamylcysteine synthetase [Trebouxia sp. A1-2]
MHSGASTHSLRCPGTCKRSVLVLQQFRIQRYRRPARSACAVAAQPAVQQLTKTDLVQYMRSGCRPKEKWRFGTEHEKLGYNLSDHKRIDYNSIKALLEGLCSRFGWEPIMEGQYIIGAVLDGQSVTIEPGGQFELSGAPVDTLHKTCSEVNSHLYQIKTMAQELGIAFLTTGFDPKWAVKDVPIMPKNRYRIMREYMPKVGTLGHDMMFRSTTIQVNIDFESEQDMVEKARIGLALQPVATALFANSPFRDGKPTGYLSWRSHVWTDVDNNRCGTLPFVFDDDFGFDRYVEYALDVPMYFVYREGQYLDATGGSFRAFMEGNLESFPGEKPTLKDWENHLSTIFPEIRLKKFIEMRGADGGPWKIICALSALWVGLLYDSESQAAALDLIKDWTRADHDHLREQVPKTALKTPFRQGTVQDLAKKMLQLSKNGLSRRGNHEEPFLEPLQEIAESGVTNAERLLEKYHNEWNESVDLIYDDAFTY